jgi:hypothetical protein
VKTASFSIYADTEMRDRLPGGLNLSNRREKPLLKIYGLVGTSGTGKSYRAGGIASNKGISYIIDDGLLIKGTRILAGTSAKKEKTKLAAIRRALFMDPGHAAQVMEAIQSENPSSI